LNLIKILPAAFFALCCFSAAGDEEQPAPVKGQVSAEKLNVRVKPGLGRSVVAVLALGDEVEVKSVEGGWMTISAPKSTGVWVAKCFVSGSELKRGATLRAGPGVFYEAFGTAPAKETVKVIDASSGNWLRIEPPSWVAAYASSRYVKLPPGTELKVKNEAPEQPQQAAPAEDSKAEEQEEEIRERAEAQLRNDVVVEGTLLPVSDSRAIATHALAAQVNGSFHTLCYLRSGSFNLQLWEGRKVRVKGVQSWIGDWRRPLVEIETITPIWQ